MLRKLLVSITFLGLIAAAGGLVVLAFWDVPVPQQSIEKPLETSKFLKKSS